MSFKEGFTQITKRIGAAVEGKKIADSTEKFRKMRESLKMKPATVKK